MNKKVLKIKQDLVLKSRIEWVLFSYGTKPHNQLIMNREKQHLRILNQVKTLKHEGILPNSQYTFYLIGDGNKKQDNNKHEISNSQENLQKRILIIDN